MTGARVVAATAALATALLVQATVIGPLVLRVPASLPAVLVAAVALVDGPGTGMAFGFAAGLIADLGSDHPAGVLALCWLGLGLVCGRFADPRRRVLGDVAIAALGCGAAALASGVIIALLHWSGGELITLLRLVIPAVVVDAVLALAVVGLARVFLRSPRRRAPRPVSLIGADR